LKCAVKGRYLNLIFKWHVSAMRRVGGEKEEEEEEELPISRAGEHGAQEFI
jgi:hypothetical protein